MFVPVDLPVPSFTDNGDVTYQAVTVPEHGTVGYRATRADGAVEYIMLNPSTTEPGDPDYQPNVFIYIGTTGDVNVDEPVGNHYELFTDD